MRRLYVSGHGQDLIYCTANTKEEARMALGPDFRSPDSDDVRMVWHLGKLDQYSGKELREKLGVSRQTVDGWRRKAGKDLPSRTSRLKQERSVRIRAILKQYKKYTATEVARMAGTTPAQVRKIAARWNMYLMPKQKRPSDDKLVELATGRTWVEFADVVGMKLATLRTYIYARPELAKRIREVRKARPCGRGSQGKIKIKTLRNLMHKGESAYRIANRFGVEQSVVLYHMRKIEKRRRKPHAPTGNGSAPDAPVDSGDGRPASVE